MVVGSWFVCLGGRFGVVVGLCAKCGGILVKQKQSHFHVYQTSVEVKLN